MFDEMPWADGDMGGVRGEDGEPGNRLMAAAKSIAVEPERGDGTAEPVETYKGRSSSCVWAKKHTLLLQFVPSLHSRVLY